ncbi:MAG TPA: hypothetical protein VEQ60_17220 [Longimicrobium sp.]|nr:hypothetical protein [Longimicrobium sp.]
MKKRSIGIVPPLVALVVGACSPDAPANPVAEAPGPSLAVQGERVATLRGALDDARTRVLPTLEGAASERVDRALARAEAALAANDAAELAAALQQARDAIESGRASLDEGAVVELDALLPLFVTLDDAVPVSLRRATTTKTD